MSDGHYVLLTGARDNAGDHLIRKRAVALLRKARPDRRIVEFDRSIKLEGSALEAVNASAALLLTGGPGIRSDMYPGTYHLSSTLDAIKVPILTYGCGWKSLAGTTREARKYRFSEPSGRLLDKIRETGIESSVRDYQTVRVLAQAGYNTFAMTGCPAYYPEDGSASADTSFVASEGRIRTIIFSTGIGHIHSRSLAAQARELLLSIKGRWPLARISAAFHHGVDAESAAKHFGARALYHLALVDWCCNQGFAILDLSGGAEKMEAAYGDCDLHVGFRVHAHILRMSGLRPSVLLAEDGRGVALGETLGGLVIKSFVRCTDGFLAKGFRFVTSGYWPELYIPDPKTKEKMIALIESEEGACWPSLKIVSSRIDASRVSMMRFLGNLP